MLSNFPLSLKYLSEHVKSGHRCLFNKYWWGFFFFFFLTDKCLRQKYTSANTVCRSVTELCVLPISYFVLHMCVCRDVFFKTLQSGLRMRSNCWFLSCFIFPAADTHSMSTAWFSSQTGVSVFFFWHNLNFSAPYHYRPCWRNVSFA